MVKIIKLYLWNRFSFTLQNNSYHHIKWYKEDNSEVRKIAYSIVIICNIVTGLRVKPAFLVIDFSINILIFSIGSLVEMNDGLIKAIQLLWHLSLESTLPCFLDVFQLHQSFLLIPSFNTVLACLEIFFDVSEGSSYDVDEEVIHHIRIVSLESKSIRSSCGRKEIGTCMKSLPTYLLR